MRHIILFMGLLAPFILGCATIDKSIHITTKGTVTVTYTTSAGVDVDAKDLIKGALK